MVAIVPHVLTKLHATARPAVAAVAALQTQWGRGCGHRVGDAPGGRAAAARGWQRWNIGGGGQRASALCHHPSWHDCSRLQTERLLISNQQASKYACSGQQARLRRATSTLAQGNRHAGSRQRNSIGLHSTTCLCVLVHQSACGAALPHHLLQHDAHAVRHNGEDAVQVHAVLSGRSDNSMIEV